jgi:hypothetical protein
VTATKDTAGHPDVTEISDLVEGVLAPDRTSSVRGHLDDCVLCADVRSALEEIRCSLGTLPGPVRMPADVAGRIDAALAAEALLSASDTTATPATAPNVSRETKRVSAEPARPTGRAGAHPSNRRPTGAARPGGPGSRTRATRRRAVAIGAAFAAAALGIGVWVTQPFQADAPAPAAATFSGQPLHQRVTGLLGEPGVSTKSSSPQPRTLVRPAVDVPSCIQAGIGGDDEALAAERGTFREKDAYLVILPDPAKGSHVTAYVVDASCITQASSGKETKGDVLLRRSYARSSN